MSDAMRDKITACVLSYHGQSLSDSDCENLTDSLVEQVALAVAEYKKDAERYRWLRMCNWHESSICVVTHPKNSVRLGHVCPSEDRLDKAIDDAISSTEQTKGA